MICENCKNYKKERKQRINFNIFESNHLLMFCKISYSSGLQKLGAHSGVCTYLAPKTSIHKKGTQKKHAPKIVMYVFFFQYKLRKKLLHSLKLKGITEKRLF